MATLAVAANTARMNIPSSTESTIRKRKRPDVSNLSLEDFVDKERKKTKKPTPVRKKAKRKKKIAPFDVIHTSFSMLTDYVNSPPPDKSAKELGIIREVIQLLQQLQKRRAAAAAEKELEDAAN